MTPAVLLLSVCIAQAPLQSTDTSTGGPGNATMAHSEAGPADAPDVPKTQTSSQAAQVAPAAKVAPATPPPTEAAPEAAGAVSTTEEAPPAPLPKLNKKSAVIAWALSFGLGMGIGNWYAEAPGQAVFVALGEIAGIVMMIVGDGGGRAAGLATFLASWALDWSTAIHNANQYNAQLEAQAQLKALTRPTELSDRGALPATHSLSITLPLGL